MNSGATALATNPQGVSSDSLGCFCPLLQFPYLAISDLLSSEVSYLAVTGWAAVSWRWGW